MKYEIQMDFLRKFPKDAIVPLRIVPSAIVHI